METGIRSYGAGKFDLEIDALVYGIIDNGADEEAGEIETTGLYTLRVGSFSVDGPFADFTADQVRDMTREERVFLRRQVGVIVREDSQGVVSVFWYDRQADLQEAWTDVLRDTDDRGDDDDGCDGMEA